jgi:NADH dehydrogenase FAD-containing subunit
MKLDGKVPEGPLADKWTNYRSKMPLVAPNNKRRLDVIVVGTGLAGASAAATLGEFGRTRLRHKVVSMQPKTIRMMEIAFGVYFTIRLKEEIIEVARVTFTA